jgi:hypothetical protein
MNTGDLTTDNQTVDSAWVKAQEIYRLALPGKGGRLDLFQLEAEMGLMPGAFIRRLLEGDRFEGAWTVTAMTEPLVKHWRVEARNLERSEGRRALALGFPIVAGMEANAPYAAPLLLWEFTLEANPYQPRQWQLTREAYHQIAPNPWLIKHWQAIGDEAPLAWLRRWAGGATSAGPKLLDDIFELAEHVGWSISGPFAPRACPGKDELDAAASTTGALYWSGVISVFPAPDPPVIAEESLPPAFTVAKLPPPKGHDFGLFDLDPAQTSAFQTILTNSATLVEGHAASGKTQLLAYLLSNALANGAKCLVVSPSLPSLQELYSRLSNLGLGRLCYIGADPARDQALLTQLLQAAAEAAPAPNPLDEERFQTALAKCLREKEKLDNAYRAVRRGVFGAKDWTDTVGLFLRSNKREGKELLASQLQAQDFRPNYEEYLQLKQAIVECQPLYRRVNTLRHPLGNLHPEIFLTQEKEAARAFIIERIDVFARKLNNLHKRFIARLNEYGEQLLRHYERWRATYATLTQELLEKIADHNVVYGNDFDLVTMTSLRVYGAFLPKYRAMLKAKEEVFRQYRALAEDYARDRYFDFSFAPAKDGRDLARMKQSLEALREALARWGERLPEMTQEEVSRLSDKTVHPALNFKGHVTALEESLDLLIAELNGARLYEQPFENKMLTISRRRKYLEEIIEHLENTRLFMRDFDAFYDWHRYWLLMSASARGVVRALTKVKPEDWVAAFESWSLHNFLSQAFDVALPSRPLPLRQYDFNHRHLRSLLAPRIIEYWERRQQAAMRDLKRGDRRLFQMVMGKKFVEEAEKRNLSQWVRRLGPLAVECLPIWLITPAAARALSFEKASFDYVIVEDAQALTLGQLGATLDAGKRWLFVANPELAALGPPHSLWRTALAAGLEPARLSYVHQLSPANILQSLDGSLVSDNAQAGHDIRLLRVEGRFDARRETNEAEAAEIIRLLHEVKKTPQRTYPSVAIVALNKPQRDLIFHHLQRLKQQGPPGAEIVSQLERGGLGVYTPEELSGQHPDLLLLSTVYDNLDGDENDRLPSVSALNQPEALARLRLLMSRPVKGLAIVSTLPEHALERFVLNPAQTGTFLLANYFFFIEALRRNDVALQLEIIERVKKAFTAGSQRRLPAHFIHEVADSLQPYLGGRRLRREVMEGNRYLPLVVDPMQADAASTVIVPDGFFAYMPATDFGWELAQWENLRDQGFVVLPAWSVNWWRNAQLEARRLAATLNGQEDGLSPQ